MSDPDASQGCDVCGGMGEVRVLGHDGCRWPFACPECVLPKRHARTAQCAEVGVSDEMVEELAQQIYKRIPFDGPSQTESKPPWLVGGNSIRQGDARTYARVAIKFITAALAGRNGK